jgi:uncharacterized protein
MPALISALTSLSNITLDGAYVFEIPPNAAAGAGVPSNLGMIDGTASWNALNVPIPFSDTPSLAAAFGPVALDPYSLVTEGYFACYSNRNFIGIRVSDGTDTAATVTIKDSGGTVIGIILTALYTGTEGSKISVTQAPGSLSTSGSPTETVTIQRGSYAPEVYPNIPAPATGAFWVNLKNAINTGAGAATKLPSQLVTAALGSSVLGPATGTNTYALAGGTNGAWGSQVTISGTTGSGPTVTIVAGGISVVYTYVSGDTTVALAAAHIAAALTANTSFAASFIATPNGAVITIVPIANLNYTLSTSVTSGAVATISLQPGAALSTAGSTPQIGSDSLTGAARTGMYAARQTGVDTFILAGNSDATVYGTMATFAQQEAALALCAFTSGLSVSSVLTAKATNGPASVYAGALKDWVYFFDQTNQQPRLVSPLGEALGLITSLNPWQSPSNKPYGGFQNITNTERSLNQPPYSYSDASNMAQAGIMWIEKGMSRSSALFGMATGRNSSAQPGIDDIAYTRMLNFCSKTIASSIGTFVGENQTTQANDKTRQDIKALLDATFQNLFEQGAIQEWDVVCDLTNNNPTTIGNGYCIASVAVQFMDIVRYMVAYVQGGSQVAVQQVQAA